MKEINIRTNSQTEMIDITDLVQAVISEKKIKSGICVVFIPHTTAAVTINENADPDVKHDLVTKLNNLIPQDEPYYRHNEGNSDSHLKTTLTGPSLTVIIDNGRLVLGTWQG